MRRQRNGRCHRYQLIPHLRMRPTTNPCACPGRETRILTVLLQDQTFPRLSLQRALNRGNFSHGTKMQGHDDENQRGRKASTALAPPCPSSAPGARPRDRDYRRPRVSSSAADSASSHDNRVPEILVGADEWWTSTGPKMPEIQDAGTRGSAVPVARPAGEAQSRRPFDVGL